MRRFVTPAALFVVFAVSASAQQPTGTSGASPAPHVLANPADASYSPAPDALPPGAEIAILAGDPMSSGPYTVRLKVPDGYKVPPHWHPTDENLTVIQGTFLVGMGDQFNPNEAKAVSVGGFATMPKEMHHFAIAQGETVIQIHGPGPFAITYVNPSDDPRSKK